MENKMTLEQFEAYLGQYGADIEAWPKHTRSAARIFAEGEEGGLCLAGEIALQDLLAAGRIQNLDVGADQQADAFALRLGDIPLNHPQVGAEKPEGQIGFLRFSRILGFFGDQSWVSVPALVSQAAVFVVVLGLGVLVGMNSGYSGLVSQTEIDVSDVLFVSATDYYLDEE